MYRLFVAVLPAIMMVLFSCGRSSQQPPISTADNACTRSSMQLKGPVKTMTKRTFIANTWQETRYEFAPDGHLTTIVYDLTTCGDQMIVNCDDKGLVRDTTYNLSGGCFDPDVDEIADPTASNEIPQKHYTGEYSEATDDYYLSTVFNDEGVMTLYHLNTGSASLHLQFFYEDDQTTLKEIQYEIVNDEGDFLKGYVIAQYDEVGNPTQWAVSAPNEPFPADILYMIDEFIPALYVEQASYSYYK